MKQLKNGAMLCLVLASLLNLGSCKQSVPPPLEICILDGYGGGDCVEKDGSKLYRSPSQMKNYWSTSEFDMQAFSQWCYGEPPAVIQSQMSKIKEATQ